VSNVTRTWIKDGLWAIALAGLVASVIRFASGLGAATGLNDSAPWGLWIAFKLVFVALAGGGFTLAAMVYIFHLERYRPILRRAILIAMLGYGSFIVSLIFDLGLPWHIYMPVINWQHHSVMFEIAWCVMLYFSVLVLEFSPVILEHPWFRHPIFETITHWLHRLTLPLIIAGIILSTLHQSSLGSLFLIMPHRVHPLWYSPWIPYLFFTSAIAAGMLALILESFIIERWFKRKLDFDLVNRLGKGAILPLGLYLALRLSDQWVRGIWPNAIDASWQSALFLAEILLCGVLPVVMLSIKKIRETREGLLTSAILGILGIMSQRMSLSMFTMYRAEGTSYIPSLGETAIAFAIPAAAVLLYLFFAENLQVFERQSQSTALSPTKGDVLSLSKGDVLSLSKGDVLSLSKGAWNEAQSYSRVPSGVFIGQSNGLREVVSRRSGFAIFVIALALPILAMKAEAPASPVSAAGGWERLHIDGNKTGYTVNFPHLDHQERFAEDVGRIDNPTGTGLQYAGRNGIPTYAETNECRVCHHLDLPEDEATACWECHADFHQPVQIFDHSLHQQEHGGNESCLECHEQEHAQLTAEICQDCHEAMVPEDGQAIFNMIAPSYEDAMHGRCLDCHEDQAVEQVKPELALCSTCHTYYQEETDQTYASLAGK
jgi:Ni/Fe-hydrogenase subunit HybB-like protein